MSNWSTLATITCSRPREARTSTHEHARKHATFVPLHNYEDWVELWRAVTALRCLQTANADRDMSHATTLLTLRVTRQRARRVTHRPNLIIDDKIKQGEAIPEWCRFIACRCGHFKLVCQAAQ